MEKNITLYDIPGADIFKKFLLDSPIPEYNILGETLIIADDWDHYNNMSLHDVIGASTHAMMTAFVSVHELDIGKWYRSKEKVAGDNPYTGYLTNKKWHLNEVFSFKQFVPSFLLIQS